MRKNFQVSTVKWITDRLPDTYEGVLVRCSYPEVLVWGALYDGTAWRWEDGGLVDGPVLGWMSLEDAAAILDAPSNAALAESLK